jgi:hypothetical protein
VLAVLCCIVFLTYTGEAQAQRVQTKKVEKPKSPKIKPSGKGERGVSNRGKIRENRSKTRSRQGEKATRGDITGRKVKTKTSPAPARSTPRAVPGQTRTTTAAVGKKRVVAPTPPRSASGNRSITNNSISGFPIKGRTASSARKTSYPKPDPYRGRKPLSEAQRAKSNKSQLSSLRSVSGSKPFSGSKYQPSSPKSASGNYVLSRRIRPYSGKQKTPWERSTNRDIAGKNLRTKNFESARPPINRVAASPRTTAKGKGDQVYRGKSPMGGIRSATRKTETSTNKDIAGRKLRHKNASSLPKTMSGPVPNIRSATKKKEAPFSGKSPYQGTMSISRKSKEGQSNTPTQSRKLSVSGKQAGTKGKALPSKYGGGGGSISQKIDRGSGGKPLAQKYTGKQSLSGARYQGSIKSKPLPQGGGSMSAKMKFGSDGKPLPQRYTGKQSMMSSRYQGGIKGSRAAKGAGPSSGFQGHMKGRQPLKGGGSITATMRRDNDGKSLAPRIPKKGFGESTVFSGNVKMARKVGQDRSARYSGNIRRAGEPIKGGGTITPDMARNNKGKPLEQLIPKKASGQSTVFSGKTRVATKPTQSKSARYQGSIRAFPPEKGGGSITSDMVRDNKGQPLEQKIPKKASGQSTVFKGNLKATKRNRLNPHTPKDGLPAWSTNKRDRQEGQLTARIKQPKYQANPKAAEESLKNLPASKATVQGGQYRGTLRQPTYSKNPHAAKDALKGIAASKSAKQGANYQGDLKLRKYDTNKKHPSYYLSKKELNAKEEKEKTFKFRLWWAKLTNKTDEQPSHLKDNSRKPGYDKKEKGLWYY